MEGKPGGIPVYSHYLKIFNYGLLWITVIGICMPILILLNISFKTNKEYTFSPFFRLPEHITNLGNYIEVFQRGNMLLGARNTLILCLAGVSICVTLGTMVAYALSRFHFRGRGLILGAYAIATTIPFVTTQVATFSIIQALHMLNTLYAAIVLYSSVSVIELYLFIQFIEKIPAELDESAMLDGASYFGIYRMIILPQIKPAIVTVIILKTLNIYNDFLVPYLYMNRPELRTISLALYRFTYDVNTQYNLVGAGVIMVMLPTMLLYVFMQKYIIAGALGGSVKG
jgi:raffinose/stachyose/melibiose transport system permease protein